MKVDYALKWEEDCRLRDLTAARTGVENRAGLYVLFVEEELETRYVGQTSNLRRQLTGYRRLHRILCCLEKRCSLLKATWSYCAAKDLQVIESLLIVHLRPTRQEHCSIWPLASVTLPDYAYKKRH